MAHSFSNWFIPTLQTPFIFGAPIVSSNVLVHPQNNLQQFVITIMNPEVSIIQDQKQIVENFDAEESLKIEDCTDLAEPTGIVKNEEINDWTDICVKEDLSMYDEESQLGEKEWIDWTELNIKEEITEDKKEDAELLAEKTPLNSSHQDEYINDKEVSDQVMCVSEIKDKNSSVKKKMKEKEVKRNGNEKFKCEYCSYKTNWRGNLTKHVISRHTALEEIKWFECAHCSYKGKTKEYLRWHLSSAHGMFTKWHNCSQCSFKAKAKCVLDKHIITAHTEDDKINWFKCDQCSYKGKLSINLKNHKINKHLKHDEINWYKCEYCAFKAKHRKNLKFHLINKHTDHERIKWFECEKCSHKVKAKKLLKMHMDKHHNENQPKKPKLGTREVPVLIGNSICWKRVPVILSTDNKKSA